MQNQVAHGMNEVTYLCECYDRNSDHLRSTISPGFFDYGGLILDVKNVLENNSDLILGMLCTTIGNYFQFALLPSLIPRPGAESTFVQQFQHIFASPNSQTIVSKFLDYDAAMGDLDNHLTILFGEFRNQAIYATRDFSLPALNEALSHLVAILTEPIGCQSFMRSQHFLTEPKTGMALRLATQQDYLLPFFSLHPADFILAAKLVRPDLSSTHTIYTMQSEFNALEAAIDTTTVTSLPHR